MLTSMTLTLGSALRSSKAFSTCLAVAPPPTSRKFAGSPPLSCEWEKRGGRGVARMMECGGQIGLKGGETGIMKCSGMEKM